jgi:hypothetical protein
MIKIFPFLKYLEKEKKDILACIGTYRDFEEGKFKLCETLLSPTSDNESGIECVDYFARSPEGKNAGTETYVISAISGSDKMSRYLEDCMSAVVAGKNKKTGENISFLSHQDPMKFLLKEMCKEQFIADFSEQLWNMKKLCRKGTIDAVFSGGSYILNESVPPQYWKEATETRERYIQSILLLSEIAEKILGFEPFVITGPKMTARSDAILYLNQYRHLYLVRPESGNITSEGYYPRNLKTQEQKWQTNNARA